MAQLRSITGTPQRGVSNADPATPTLPGAATAGNLLIVWAGERSGATSVTTPTGYTKFVENYANAADGTYRRSLVGFYKVAAGGETSASIAFDSTGNIRAIIEEYEPTGDDDEFTFLEAVSANSGAADGGTSLASGNTSSLTFARALVLAGWFGKQSNQSGSPENYADLAFSNVPTNAFLSVETNGRNVGTGWGSTETDGVQSTTASWTLPTGDSRAQIVALGVFRTKAAGGAAYDLTCAQGSYALTGQAVTLTYSGAAYAMGCAQGSYALTGQSMTMTHGRVMPCASGTYTLTGAEALADYEMSCVAGSYALTGQAIGLRAAHRMACAAGSYALTGQAITLTHGLQLTCAAGNYDLTGQDATLTHTPIAGAFTMSCEAGSYALTGQAIALRAAHGVLCEAGSYELTGQDVELIRGPAQLVCAPGSFTLSGQEIGLAYSGAPAGGDWWVIERRRRGRA